MRIYGRIGLEWYAVNTDTGGLNDDVYMTALIQILKLVLGESPFYAQSGIPTLSAVIQQMFPDYYVALVQQQYAPYFLTLQIARASSYPLVYTVQIITHSGAQFTHSVEAPQ